MSQSQSDEYYEDYDEPDYDDDGVSHHMIDPLDFHMRWKALLQKRRTWKVAEGVDKIPGFKSLMELLQTHKEQDLVAFAKPVQDLEKQVAESKTTTGNLRNKLADALSAVRNTTIGSEEQLMHAVEVRNRARQDLAAALEKQSFPILMFACNVILHKRFLPRKPKGKKSSDEGRQAGEESAESHLDSAALDLPTRVSRLQVEWKNSSEQREVLHKSVVMIEEDICLRQRALCELCNGVFGQQHERIGVFCDEWDSASPTVKEALGCYDQFLEKCSFEDDSCTTDEAVNALEKAWSQPEIMQIFSKDVENTSEASVHNLKDSFNAALDAVVTEMNNRNNWNPLQHLPIVALISAAHALLDSQRRAVASLVLAQDTCMEFASETDVINTAIGEKDKLKRVMDKVQEATEARIEACENVESAELKIQQKKRRGKDPEDSELSSFTECKTILRQKEGELLKATVLLSEFEHHFPEVAKHFKPGLPVELWPLWHADRTLQYFDELEALLTPSRHHVYKVTVNLPHVQVFAVKEFKVNESSLQRCYREARILHRLRHPHIAQIAALFQDPRQHAFYLQMPFYKHGSIDMWIDTSNPDDTSRLRALTEILEALAHLHAHDVVHADVKPQNMLIDADGRAFLADFDVSVDQATRLSSSRATTTIAFTLDFVAPELSNTGATPATDMFAFGVSLNKIGLNRTSAEGAQLILQLKSDVPQTRPSATQALQDDCFKPVFQWKQKELRRCCVMASEDCDYGGKQCSLHTGLECSSCSHFACASCLDAHVVAECNKSLRERTAREGKIYPPCYPVQCQHSTPFPDRVLAKMLKPATFEAYFASRLELLEKQKAEELEADMQRRLEAERVQLQALRNADAAQQRVENACRYISEEILTLKCPQCGQAFIDFDGCFALSCSRCPCHFCAWCGQAAGRGQQGDQLAHAHLPQCQHRRSSDPYYGTSEEFEIAQCARRRSLLNTYLSSLDTPLRSAVVKAMAKNFTDLGLGDVR